MPVRKRISAVSPCEVNPTVFQYGNGTWSFFEFVGDAVYPTRASAKRAWRQVRREIWATCKRFHPPNAATVYDGLTRDSIDLLWSTWKPERWDDRLRPLPPVPFDLRPV